jgi:site-specific recombinase XerD
MKSTALFIPLGSPVVRQNLIGYNQTTRGSALDTLPSGVVAAQGNLDAAPPHELLSKFLQSRRQGLSPQTLHFYSKRIEKASAVVGLSVSGQEIIAFLDSLTCTNGGKHSYWRALGVFYNWLYSQKSGYRLNPQDNPILLVQPPKVEKRILPSVTDQQVEQLIGAADNVRDRCMVSLLADSGIRLSELCGVTRDDISWDSRTVTIIGKGNKQRRAPFTERTDALLRAYLADNHAVGTIWGINQNGVQKVLRTLWLATGIKCNPHSFRRGFACNLHRKGLSTLDIMHLGGWNDLSMVLRYTRSITFDDCLKHYQAVLD